MSVSEPRIQYIDALNNEGFSGGPVFFRQLKDQAKYCVAGVVSKFRVEQERVLNAEGEPTGEYVEFNTGFLVSYDIIYAVTLAKRYIEARRD